jgi:subfamily B ATP-binding cassette protein MsbA
MHRIVPMVIDIIHDIFKIAGLVGACFYMEPYLSILAIFAFPLTVYPVQAYSTRMKRYTKKGLKEAAVINSMMQETYSGAKVVKAFAMERTEVGRYQDVMQRLLKIQFKYAAAKHAISPMIGVIAAFGVAPIAYMAGRRVLSVVYEDAGGVANLAAYVVAVTLMYDPVRKLGSTMGHISSAYGAAERIRETFEYQSTVQEAPDAIDIPPMQNEIRYENVSFKYTDETVLADFNLTAKKGQLIALVGVSGSGKSTVVNLLPRFYDATQGRITIDGLDIKKATFKSLRSQIGVVTQETFLFDGTVASNILYGSEGKPLEEVIKVAKAAKVHDFVEKLPKGYETEIGERGVRLSGGERQRIAIARALLKDPPILLLDEATSALDTAAEREVQAALDSLMAHRTTIAIAHRLSTITHADKIVVIKKGRMVEQGTHEELMKLGGEYKRLYEMQFFLGEFKTDHYRGRERPEAKPVD